MLKKLYKHELSALTRWLKFVWIAIIGIAIFNRISLAIYTNMLEQAHNAGTSETVHQLALTLVISIMGLHGLSIVASQIVTSLITVVRFYKNMFSNEGYFTFSIPVKPTTHLWCKLFCALIVSLITAIVTTISICILFIGMPQIWQALGEILSGISKISFEIMQSGNTIHLILFSIEFFVLYVSATLMPTLMIYASICLGQSFKNKIGGAVICYLVINVILNIVSSIGSFILQILIMGIVALESVAAIWLVHIIIFILLAFTVGLCVVFFIICNNRINKKLNLE